MAYLIEINDIVENAGALLTLPDICMQVKRLVADLDSSIAEIAELIAKDPALTARLLKIVNSSFYYFPREISSVSEAITLIGTSQLYNLALATTAASIIKTVGGSYIELKTLWKKAVYSAMFANSFQVENDQNSEGLFVAGLLSNIGALAVVRHAPDIALTAIGPPNIGQYYWQREEEVLGFTIAEVSGLLLKSWNLPEEIIVSVLYQHRLDKQQVHFESCCILHLATRLASEMICVEQGMSADYRKAIDEEAMMQLGLTQEDLEIKIAEVHELAPEILTLFIH